MQTVVFSWSYDIGLVRHWAACCLAASGLLTACAPNEGSRPAPVDYLFENAKVYTVDPNNPWASTVAIRDGTIVSVGDAQSASGLIGPNTQRNDLNGQLLLPGFIDTHVHPLDGGAFANALSLDTAGSMQDWLTAIAAYADANAESDILFGYGFLATVFGPNGPTRGQLDQIVPDIPVLIMDEGFHAAWANSAALSALGIDRDTPDPVPNYSYYQRDLDGNPTGYLLEGTASMAMEQLDIVNPESLLEGTRLILQRMNAYGVTALFDAGPLDSNREQTQHIWSTLERDESLTLKVVGASRPVQTEDTSISAASAVDNALQWTAEVTGLRHHYSMLKIPADGTVESQTAAMFEDYQGQPGNSGELVYSPAELTLMMTAAAAVNMDVHIHALGERAIHETLNAIEAAQGTHPATSSRYTICHIQVLTDADLPRFSKLGVVAQSTPLWASYDEFGKPMVSEDQFNRYWRFNSLRDSGARLTFGSDFPASGAGVLGLSPLRQIEIGHTRQSAGEADAPIQPLVSERLSVEALVKGFTLDAAWQLHMEDSIGSIEVGKAADMIVLDQNIFSIDPYRIHETNVTLTMLDGEIVHQSNLHTETKP